MQSASVADETLRLQLPTGEALLPRNEEFAVKFNRTDFWFDHGLAHHPLFQLPSLLSLAERIPKYKDFVYWQNGRVKVDDKWGANPAPRLSLEDTIKGIATNDSLVILKHADQDPVFGPLLQEILQRIWSFTSAPHQDDIMVGESLIFLNSPRRKTAYHLDLESNFLLQVRGEKLVHVFDSTDRSLTPHTELENHCAGDSNGARYKPERESDAHFYRLTPGHGVHFPSMAPHWVENGDELSVSININFDVASVHHRLKRVYRINRMLRRLGVTPTDPGASPLRDTIKEKLSVAFSRLRGSGAARGPDETYPMWRPQRHPPADRVANH